MELDDELVAEVDRLAGRRGRSAFVRAAVARAVEQERRWRSLEAAAGSIRDTGPDRDDDRAAWVREPRGSDPRRVG